MMAQPSIQTVHYRLAQHYLDKMKQAESGVRRGRENRDHWFNLIQQDWVQIKQWQAWAAAWTDAEVERARLCAAFPIGTLNVLRVQLTPAEQLSWTQQALDAALRLQDAEAQRLLLYQVAFVSLTLENLDQADQFSHQLMERAQAAGDTLNIGRAWYLRGTASFTRGLYDRAEDCYGNSIAHFEACDAVEEIPIVWRGLGRIALLRGEYEQAQMYQQRYLHASKSAGNEQGVLDAHVALSSVFLPLRDYLAAEHHAQRAVALARPLGRSRFLPAALFSLAHAQKWLGKYESACGHYEEGIAVARALSYAPSSIANGLYGLGQAKYLQGDFAAALSWFEEALEIACSAGLVLRIGQITHDMVFAHVACGDFDAARARLREALAAARQLGTSHFMVKVLAAAVALWQHTGEPEQAAVWAGLLNNHREKLHPTLFDAAVVYGQLEAELGTVRYRDALERGQALALDNVLAEIIALLNVEGFSLDHQDGV